MSTRDVQHKLAAILSADVKGYSRLMADDDLANFLFASIFFIFFSTRRTFAK
jgi:hypothetical protein